MRNMNRIALIMGLSLVMAGCESDRGKRPEYGRARPPVGELDSRDRGLQSKDVVAASEQMTMDLLALPELNASRDQWLIVVDRVDNMTGYRRENLDIFIRRVGVILFQQGRGRVQLVENRDKLRELQSRELEQPGGDPFGQGGAGRAAPGAAGYQPQFALYAKMMELPNRRTSYFLCEFTLTDLRDRRIVWTNQYEVKAEM